MQLWKNKHSFSETFFMTSEMGISSRWYPTEPQDKHALPWCIPAWWCFSLFLRKTAKRGTQSLWPYTMFIYFIIFFLSSVYIFYANKTFLAYGPFPPCELGLMGIFLSQITYTEWSFNKQWAEGQENWFLSPHTPFIKVLSCSIAIQWVGVALDLHWVGVKTEGQALLVIHWRFHESVSAS